MTSAICLGVYCWPQGIMRAPVGSMPLLSAGVPSLMILKMSRGAAPYFHSPSMRESPSLWGASSFSPWQVKQIVLYSCSPLATMAESGCVRNEAFGLRDEATLAPALAGLPGIHRVAVPGHTPGSVVLHAPGVDTLFVGDAFSTYSVTTGSNGPQISPFTADPDQALASLRRLEGIEAKWLLPGHGDAWTDGVGEAVRQVRATGVDHLAKPSA